MPDTFLSLEPEHDSARGAVPSLSPLAPVSGHSCVAEFTNENELTFSFIQSERTVCIEVPGQGIGPISFKKGGGVKCTKVVLQSGYRIEITLPSNRKVVYTVTDTNSLFLSKLSVRFFNCDVQEEKCGGGGTEEDYRTPTVVSPTLSGMLSLAPSPNKDIRLFRRSQDRSSSIMSFASNGDGALLSALMQDSQQHIPNMQNRRFEWNVSPVPVDTYFHDESTVLQWDMQVGTEENMPHGNVAKKNIREGILYHGTILCLKGMQLQSPASPITQYIDAMKYDFTIHLEHAMALTRDLRCLQNFITAQNHNDFFCTLTTESKAYKEPSGMAVNMVCHGASTGVHADECSSGWKIIKTDRGMYFHHSRFWKYTSGSVVVEIWMDFKNVQKMIECSDKLVHFVEGRVLKAWPQCIYSSDYETNIANTMMQVLASLSTVQTVFLDDQVSLGMGHVCFEKTKLAIFSFLEGLYFYSLFFTPSPVCEADWRKDKVVSTEHSAIIKQAIESKFAEESVHFNVQMLQYFLSLLSIPDWNCDKNLDMQNVFFNGSVAKIRIDVDRISVFSSLTAGIHVSQKNMSNWVENFATTIRELFKPGDVDNAVADVIVEIGCNLPSHFCSLWKSLEFDVGDMYRVEMKCIVVDSGIHTDNCSRYEVIKCAPTGNFLLINNTGLFDANKLDIQNARIVVFSKTKKGIQQNIPAVVSKAYTNFFHVLGATKNGQRVILAPCYVPIIYGDHNASQCAKEEDCKIFSRKPTRSMSKGNSCGVPSRKKSKSEDMDSKTPVNVSTSNNSKNKKHVTSDTGENEMSEYERKVQENRKRNMAIMASLGLNDAVSTFQSATKNTKKIKASRNQTLRPDCEKEHCTRSSQLQFFTVFDSKRDDFNNFTSVDDEKKEKTKNGDTKMKKRKKNRDEKSKKRRKEKEREGGCGSERDESTEKMAKSHKKKRRKKEREGGCGSERDELTEKMAKSRKKKRRKKEWEGGCGSERDESTADTKKSHEEKRKHEQLPLEVDVSAASSGNPLGIVKFFDSRPNSDDEP